MGLRIATNVNSLFAQRQLGLSTQRLNKHTERASSGYRINRAADDAAGLAISEKLRAEVRGLGQAKRNAADGISLVQTAEGGLNEITNIVVRLKELAVQAASDTIGNQERGFLQKEFGALKSEIDRIATSTEYNGTLLLTGRAELPDVLSEKSNKPPLEIQVGSKYHPLTDGLDLPNPVNIIRIDLQDINALTEGPGSLGIGTGHAEDGTRVDSKVTAQSTINAMDSALEKINSYRATLGSIQSRLNSTVSSLAIQIENLESSKSRIKDADYAEESAHIVQQSILQKAGVSILSQANQMPELALKLLQ
jgi:flagellin